LANVEQFEKAVTEAGAVAMRSMRGPGGAERLIIQTPGGLITKEVPLIGDLGEDIQHAAIAAREIVASAKRLTAAPARNLSAPSVTAVRTDNLMPIASRALRRP
jgi:4-hydroxyphenylpyruvate dioxygenase-like putative hemolysin